MSLTKRDSPTEVGTERDFDYEAWSNSLPSISQEDLAAMADEDLRRRVKDAEAEIGRCGLREEW